MFKRVLVSVWHHGRRFLEDGIRLQKIKPSAKLGRKQELRERNRWLNSDKQYLVQRTWVQNILGKSVQKFSTNLRNANKFQSGSFSIFSRSFGQRSLFPRAPYFAFVGVGLAVASQIQKEEESGFHGKQLISDIQNVVTKQKESRVSEGSPPDDSCGQSVDDYEFKEMIAKGCNAAVHEAEKVQENQEQRKHQGNNSLAIKVMFNLFHESNYFAIMRGMAKEIIPAKEISDNSQYFFGKFGISPHKKKRLKPHPNIVDIKRVFVDDMKAFDGCETEYPASLPSSLCSFGLGRNKTMYIVMKKYDCTLREYMASPSTPSVQYRESLQLFSQLLEGILHLNLESIAHRDLKSDNILVDHLSTPSPRLVICDFGCCVDGLRVPYNTSEVDKGGNVTLMAPEIVTAEPGPTAYLDYTKSDLWAAGSLAYEIFGSDNPFYGQFGWMEGLNSQTYQDQELPCLGGDVPVYVNNLVKAMLKRNPEERPDPLLVANTLQLILWAPAEWLTPSHNHPPPEAITTWLLITASQYLLSGNKSCVESQLKELFLSRLDLDQLLNSFRFLWSLNPN